MARTATAAHVFPAGASERQGLRAGVVSRVVTMGVDAAYVVAITGFLYLGYASFRFLRGPVKFTWPRTSFLWLLMVAAVITILVLTFAWTGIGRTMGMRFMGLRLQAADGGRVHLGRSFLRAVTCVVFPLGLFWSAISKRNASVQDLLFGTSVVYDWHARVPDPRSE